MKFDVSSILKLDGAQLPIEINQVIEGLDTISDEVSFELPVSFKGTILNIGGVLNLKGEFNATYKTVCSRCLKGIEAEMSIDVREDFFEEGKSEEEAYTYTGKYVELEKVFRDNIVLNLPTKQVCSKQCKGLCPDCGTNLNEKTCDCKDDEIDSRLEVLKNYFKNQEDN
ncbi:DUF177 domain-containing protein [Herbivorax sp. ANBcel31]|uniref:YceD family protein n=1 Tax=Herbivorax sp. ANBcel31 TaxID=3069754 RepID=UPI0027B28C0E|nr:DUF177 domain-containing protein [Herbivorax sp. ANBcel31]MDQ2087729.1 DUF177 domain-containing protein [Herbivorax sp. ANBcel31]